MSNKAGLQHSQRPLQKLLSRLSFTLVGAFCLAGIFVIQQNSRLDEQIQFEDELAFENNDADKSSFVLFTLPQCYPCKLLEEQIAQQPQLKGYIRKNFRSYRIDGRDHYSGGKEIAELYGITEYPTIIITDPEGKLLGKLSFKSLIEEAPQALNQVLKHNAMDVIPVRSQEKTLGRQPEKELGLLFRTTDNWSEAMELIHFLEKNWNEEIWLSPRADHSIQVIIGRYPTMEKARLTRKFLKLWEGEKTKVVPLHVEVLKYGKKSKTK
ncbi:MAG: thioredoxin fold domain-containing protein [Bacteroidia bacterium]|nr:thioredoxin fold domain-containing protein [Bacteroidia bacterium]